MALSKAELTELIKEAMAGDDWAGSADDVILKGVNWTYVPDDGERTLLQAVGEKHGCHVCGKKIEDCPEEQKWDADHQPPVNLSATALKHYLDDGVVTLTSKGGETLLFPQCKPCSKAQSALVRKINASVKVGVLALTKEQVKLVQGHGKFAKSLLNFIPASGDVANGTEKLNIQRLGKVFGCHSCGARFPVTDYEADHVPPTTLFQYTWVGNLLTQLVIAPHVFKIRPACPRCQRSQGGKVASVLREAARYIYANNLNILILTPGFAKSDVGT